MKIHAQVKPDKISFFFGLLNRSIFNINSLNFPEMEISFGLKVTKVSSSLTAHRVGFLVSLRNCFVLEGLPK